MSIHSKQRKHDRVPLNLLVQFRINDFSSFMKDYANNISAGGMFLHAEEIRPIGSLIYFQFALREGTRLIEGLGRVVRAQPDGMGIEFVGLEDKSKAMIEHIVQQRMGLCA